MTVPSSAKTDNRPQFQQMIKDSERGIFDVIIVWELDRFARNRYDSARYKTQLKRNGVKLVSATEVISAGPEGIILESVLKICHLRRIIIYQFGVPEKTGHLKNLTLIK